MALRRPGACRHAHRARCGEELERSPRVLEALLTPILVQRKDRQRLRRHGYSDFASSQLGLCFAEEQSDGRRSLRWRVGQRNTKLPRLIGIVEGDDNTFLL